MPGGLTTTTATTKPLSLFTAEFGPILLLSESVSQKAVVGCSSQSTFFDNNLPKVSPRLLSCSCLSSADAI